MKNTIKFLALFIISITIASCCNDDDSNNNETNGTARMAIRLTDAPGDYEAVLVDVENVVIKYNDNEEETFFADINAGVYDLLELTAGVNVLLVDEDIPAGDISQIRLVLGENNTIVVDGQTYDLNTPSAQQSGLKVQVNETLEDGIFYEFILDFDVDKSIVQTGNGSYNLKPVIRASTVAETGAISGTVLPLGVQTIVTADNGIDEISAFTDETGNFLLNGVPSGTYTVTIEADADANLSPIVIQDVQVNVGSVTTLESVEF